MANNKPKLAYLVILMIVLLVVAVGVHKSYRFQNGYSLKDLGISQPAQTDCASVAGTDNNYPVTVSFNTENVSQTREAIKNLISKYKGEVSQDSFSSYPSETAVYDSANITAYFPNGQKAFLEELSQTVKKSSANSPGYSFQDQGRQYGYSPASTCKTYLQNVAVNQKLLEILTLALKRERTPKNIALISQSIATARTTLESEIANLDEFFRANSKPLVNISINSPSQY